MSGPLPLLEVLKDEQRALGKTFARVSDSAKLAATLKNDDLVVSRRLRERLLVPTQRGLAAWTAGPVPTNLLETLVAELDGIVSDLSFVATIEEFYQLVHWMRVHGGLGRSALCLSGGGIRSATFGLGVVQGLAEQGLLGTFDYLSTVSGGGYIGSWLTAWIHRHPRGRGGVVHDLARSTGKPLEPEARPIRHLREYSNYLTPKLGLFSADTWTGAASYLRNLILNWLVLVPMLLFVLAIPRFWVSVLHWNAFAGTESLGAWALGAGAGLAAIATALLIASIVFMAVARPSLEDREQGTVHARTPREYRHRFAYRCLGPLVVSAVVLAAMWSWANYVACADDQLLAFSTEQVDFCGHLNESWFLGGFVIGGAMLHAVAWLLYAYWLPRETRFPEGWRVILSGGVGGFLGWLAAVKISRNWPTEEYADLYVVVGAPVILLIILLTATFFVGLMSRLMDDEDREWSARFGGIVMMTMAGWIVVSGLAIFGPGVFSPAGTWVSAAGGASGVVTLVAGWSAKSAARGATGQRSSLLAALGGHATTVIAGVFAAFIAILLSWATSALMANIFTLPLPRTINGSVTHHDVLLASLVWQTALAAVVPFLVGYLMARVVNANKFSLHAMYRSRLIRAYLGASRSVRTPNGFTGFDPNDNIQMHSLATELRAEIDTVDVAAFIAAIAPATPLAGALKALLNPGTAEHLARPGAAASAEVAARLRDDLNAAIYSNRRIFSFDPWAKIRGEPPFSAAVITRHRNPAHGDELILLNRDMLAEAGAGIPARPPGDPQRPLHVISMALNLVGGSDLAWQERQAESFTVSPLHAGSSAHSLGYRRSKEYGGNDTPSGISLGTAVAISGAAASPNQGYHSSPLVTFLMALFNVRLGWWLGNPGKAGDTLAQGVVSAAARGTLAAYGPDTLKRSMRDVAPAYTLAYPDNSLLPLLQETLGLTDDQKRFVYLSDGGHFENLGLYEMVLRRCHVIVVSDAGCDPECSLEDLGNAIRKIRVDFRISITFDAFDVRRRLAPGAPPASGAGPGPATKYCAVGRIHYRDIDGSGVPDGILVYIKPAFYGDEPRDIFNYATAHAAFPHETTANQWFTESQFESYRMLGHYAVTRIGGAGPVGGLDDFCNRAGRYVRAVR
jgi:hypothetical protein